MKVPKGKVVYREGRVSCSGVGLEWSQRDFDVALGGPVLSVLFDEEGNARIEEMLIGLAETEFNQDGLRRLLSAPGHIENWRVGEAIAEKYLVDHRNCLFPWPAKRDERKSGSSLPGADLIGLQSDNRGDCLAFGEVKTSSEARYPPSVMKGSAGLETQLGRLRSQESLRDDLLKYLWYRLTGDAPWRDRFENASKRYLRDRSDVQLFGFLVRDVAPNRNDLCGGLRTLDKNRPPKIGIELVALYLPQKSIDSMGDTAITAWRGDNA